jgi:ATP-dependent DNA helicase RecG
MEKKMMFKESETVELKEIVVDDIKKELIAFANSEGGKLYVGIQDDGTIVGVKKPDEAALQISNMVRDNIKPDLSMFLHYNTLKINDKEIVAVDVQRGTNRPYYLAQKGLRPEGVYVRQGYSSVSASDTAIRRMIKETDGDHFEDMRSLEQNLTFTAAQKEFSNRNIPLGSMQMKTLGIINKDDVYTNLGLLLSDQCKHSIKAAVFQGTTPNIFKDRKEFSGSLFQQMNDVYEYIDFHNKTQATFEGLYRIDTKDYKETAVREALLNSLVHREYSMSASTFISIYDDRIEFTSVGGLVTGITLNDVMMGISVCRNEKLANVFYRLELIEAYGTGMRKIMDAYADYAVKPAFQISDNAFKVILPNCNSQPVQAPTNNLADLQEERILSLAKKQGTITRKEVEHLLDIGQTTSGRLLKKAIEKGLLVQEGTGKNTRYKCK